MLIRKTPKNSGGKRFIWQYKASKKVRRPCSTLCGRDTPWSHCRSTVCSRIGKERSHSTKITRFLSRCSWRNRENIYHADYSAFSGTPRSKCHIYCDICSRSFPPWTGLYCAFRFHWADSMWLWQRLQHLHGLEISSTDSKADLIIWDEIVMCARYCTEGVERTL